MVYLIVPLLLLAFSDRYFLASSRPLPGNVWFALRYWLFQLLTYKVRLLIAGTPECRVCLGRRLVLHVTSPLHVSVTLWNGIMAKAQEQLGVYTSENHTSALKNEQLYLFQVFLYLPGTGWASRSTKWHCASHVLSALGIRPGSKACRFAL